MGLTKWLAGVALAIAVLVPFKPASAEEQSNSAFAHAAEPVYALIRAGNCAAAIPKLRELSLRPDFSTNDASTAYAFWESFLGCAHTQFDWKDGYDAVKHATAFPQATVADWRQRAFIALHVKEWEDSIVALETMAKIDPGAVSNIKDSLITTYYTNIQDAPNAGDMEFRFLTVLWNTHWRSSEPGGDNDSLWMDYAGWLQSKHRSDEVVAVLHVLEDPDSIHNVRLNPQWRDVVEADPAAFDVLAVAKKRLAALAAAKTAHPDRLIALIGHARLLRELGRVDEALNELNAALPKMATFTDSDEMLRWWTDERMRALRDLGRFDEAVADLREGATLREATGRTPAEEQNVSQLINLAYLQNDLGKPDDAIKTLSILNDGSPASSHGFAVAALSRACAYAQLDRKKEFEAQLAKLDELGADWSYQVKAMVCANDLDAAAEIYVARLEREGDAWTALFDLSGFTRPPHEAPFAAKLRRRMTILAARRDVQAAIARSGGHLEQSPLLDW